MVKQALVWLFWSDHVRPRLHFLDGLRGWGALSVLLYHVFVNALPLNQRSADVLLHIPFFNGILAVWIFFVVSGFSLSIGFMQTNNKALLKNMLVGRYFRLAIPVLFCCMIVYIAFKLHLILPKNFRPEALRFDLLSPPTLLETVRFSLYNTFFHYGGQGATLIPPLWSMRFELAGSFIVLFSLYFLNTPAQKKLAYFCIVAILYWVKPMLAIFLAGVIWASLYNVFSESRMKRYELFTGVLFLASWVICFFLPNHEWYFLAATLLSFSCMFNPAIRRFLSNRFSVFLGKISFSLYLIHAPVIYIFSIRAYHDFGSHSGSRFVINVLTVMIAIVCARALCFIDRFSIMVSRKIAQFFVSEPRALASG